MRGKKVFFFFFTQVFNLTGRKRLRLSNSKCACATAKRFRNAEKNLLRARRGGLYGGQKDAGMYGTLTQLWEVFFYQTEINYKF